MQIKVTDKNYSMNEMLKNNLDFLIKAVNRKWDGILLIDGVEGSGKTTNGNQISYYESYQSKRPYNLDNVVFTAEQFETAVNTLPPKSAILWDEAVFGALGIEWATVINKTITKLMVTIRKKQLFINIIIPWIYMLQAYLAVGRTRALIHVITPDGISRGFFKFYDYGGKQQLYFKNKKYYTYYGVKEIFKGTFPDTNGLFYSEKEYDKKKDDAIRTLLEKNETPGVRAQKQMAQRNIAIRGWSKYERVVDMMKELDMSKRQVEQIINYESKV